MTDTPIDRVSVERTRQEILDHCKGHPYAAIPWPHRALHTAADTLLALRAALDEAEEIERLRKRVEAADRLADASTYFSTAFSGPNATKLLQALAAYRKATEGGE